MDSDRVDFWGENAFKERLATGTNMISVGIESYGHVKGQIIILEEENKDFDIVKYDHIVETLLFVPSGILQIIPCTDNVPYLEIELYPQTYKIRIYSVNLESVVDEEGDDFYTIEIWPQANRTVLKQFTHPYFRNNN